jgi:hypothetical protein
MAAFCQAIAIAPDDAQASMLLVKRNQYVDAHVVGILGFAPSQWKCNTSNPAGMPVLA